MSYTITSHNNELKTFDVTINGKTVTLNFPQDIENFTNITTNDLDIIISGFIHLFTENESNETNKISNSAPGLDSTENWIF